ncbi:FBD domain-containing protein [Heracleum sosnowskyi]|uniref:FBD domain-containing protein n=1 Tax=Heracleum sosnowskyi TaxID=360622 RepID=A0AAD8M0X7_9APIA|nr:FBD domain-containing protein [Heracleum sosnowskyi]
MAESSTRKVGRAEKDIFSELPQNVQEIILCFLPIKDAVRTSILSRTWKYRWTMIPHLIFDYEFFRSMNINYDDETLKAYKFVSVINQVLLLHNGPVLKLSLTIPGHDCDAEIIHEFIDQWIPLLSRNGIKELILVDTELRIVKPHHYSSLDLTYLSLYGVCFSDKPTFGRFTYLTNLELIGTTLCFDFGKNICDCPVLEKLTLVKCDGLFPNHFRAPKLKCLHQVYYIITPEYSLAGLENLKDFSLLLSWFLYPQDFIEVAKTSNVVKILDWLHKIEKFSIAGNFNKYLAGEGSPNRLSKSLPYLKTLNISDVNFNDRSEISCLLCLIRSAPNLCKLHISANRYCEGEDLNNYWIEDSEDFIVGHLEIVTFSYFEGLQAELELIKLLLAWSPLLKTMSIHFSKDERKRDVALTAGEKILKYSGSSSGAQISRLKHPVKIDEYDHDLWWDME